MTNMNKLCLFAVLFFLSLGAAAQVADTETYLSPVKAELVKKWPQNRTINLVFHGHSVPSGYFRTPEVRTLEAYPFLVLEGLKKQYPTAVINSITTSIGAENSEQGQKRFKRDVLTHNPDVLFIDYALNDRSIGLERSREAMEKMIKKALKKNIKIILLTPSPDIAVDILKPDNLLEQHSRQLIKLAEKYKIGLVDSQGAFKSLVQSGEDLKSYMAQSNHPDKKGHMVIANEILKWFKYKPFLLKTGAD
jgi:acyl-CoA thioesterase I